MLEDVSVYWINRVVFAYSSGSERAFLYSGGGERVSLEAELILSNGGKNLDVVCQSKNMYKAER